jgi:hypothetical protein
MKQLPAMNEFEEIARKQRTVQDADYSHCYYSTLDIAFLGDSQFSEAKDEYPTVIFVRLEYFPPCK